MTTIGETIVAEIEIESATKRQRQTASGELIEWALRIFVPALGIRQFSTPTSMDAAWAPEIMAGEKHVVTLRRGRLKADKTGAWDSDYFYDLIEWDTEQPVPIQASSTRPEDGYRRSATEMRWTEAIHAANVRLAPRDDASLHDVEVMAGSFYAMILHGPPTELPTTAPETPDQPAPVVAEEEELLCTIHKVPPDGYLASGLEYHIVGAGARCLAQFTPGGEPVVAAPAL